MMNKSRSSDFSYQLSKTNDLNINNNLLGRICFYRQMGMSYYQIAKKLNCSVKLVHYYLNK